MYRTVKHMTADKMESVKQLYDNFGTDVELDESDLVIFRLMGVEFNYSAVEFNPPDVAAESDAS